ncbi:MAG: folate hydrolase, partial [Rhodothermales bacterium]|nr:folate hydrolase [Rhodothermales bacterium]
MSTKRASSRLNKRLVAIASILVVAGLGPLPVDSLTGFRSDRVPAQLQLEENFDAQLDSDNLHEWMQVMTSKPQHVGSTHGKANAEYVAELFTSWGFDTEIEVFNVLFPTPIERRLVLKNGKSTFRARLEEPAIKGDRSSGVRKEMLPPYNAYSADGDVTAELVYVNYGIPADYEELDRRGISVEGKIVIARYGGSWRGIKPKVAAEHGAIGCILFSDPRDDGYFRGDAYPEGSFRMKWGAQRGSVSDMPTFPGDPLTPFVGATEDAERLTVEEAPTIMKIPVLPISWGDAQPLLEAMGGPVAPQAWRGALPLT